MKGLVLYSGTQSIDIPFKNNGHEILSVELNEDFTKSPWNLEQWTISVSDVTVNEVISRLGGIPDFIWASPVCTTHSIAAISTHRYKDGKFLYPKSQKAHQHDILLQSTLDLIEEFLLLNPNMIYFIENPRGGMRKSHLMTHYNEVGRYTITYCQYGDTRMKPTDIWTNYFNPMFKPPCSPGADCHEAAPRGSKTGTQGLKGNLERSIIPKEFCEYIVKLMEVKLHDY